MKKLMLSMLIAVSAMALVAADADARRMGGGGSFGRQSSNVSRQMAPAQAPSNSFARPAAPTAAPGAIPPAARPASPWRGMLGGALLGLGAGALLSHFGFGGAMGGMFGSILTIALLAFAGVFLFRMLRRKTAEPAPAYMGAGPANRDFSSSAPYARDITPDIGSALPAPGASTGFGSSAAAAAPVNAGTWTIPADFDVPAFLRNAKTYFIRLQAAWDKADLNDIREFTSSEMFAEFRLELQERGSSANVTDVVKLDAEMLGVETIGSDYLASVKFTGLIKEDPAADAAPFAEVWNLSKPTNGQGGWVLAGIQQLS
jgi:predicted lipid-binding transport protein (Tim44 family)